MYKIVLYSDKQSEFSDKARLWLGGHGFVFEERDVAETENLESLFSISEQYAVPVIIIDGKVVIGFNEKKLEELLIPQRI